MPPSPRSRPNVRNERVKLPRCLFSNQKSRFSMRWRQNGSHYSSDELDSDHDDGMARHRRQETLCLFLYVCRRKNWLSIRRRLDAIHFGGRDDGSFMSAPFKWEEGADGGQPWLIIFRPGDGAAFRTLDFSFSFGLVWESGRILFLLRKANVLR